MVGMKTDVGIIRTLNEDYAGYIREKDYSLFVVADGMGGHNAGEVASKIAVETIEEYIKEHIYNENINVLESAVKFANAKIAEKASESIECKGMGTTVVACLFTKNSIVVANVGDSQGYGICDNEITKITKDHSLVQELIDIGTITEEEGRVHPKKNIITRALGTSASVQVDIFNLEKDKYSKLLLCTDGLTNELSKSEILSVINENVDYEVICENLVSLAKKRGGRDNITVLLFGGEV